MQENIETNWGNCGSKLFFFFGQYCGSKLDKGKGTPCYLPPVFQHDMTGFHRLRANRFLVKPRLKSDQQHLTLMFTSSQTFTSSQIQTKKQKRKKRKIIKPDAWNWHWYIMVFFILISCNRKMLEEEFYWIFKNYYIKMLR